MANIKQPMSVQEDGSQRITGKDAQRMNILAGKIVADIIKTTLGPRGMDKMLVDYTGDVMITNDGATILNKIDISHPAAKMIVEVARTQDQEVGDGTTTAVVLAGELLRKAESLLDTNIHATNIASGYKTASEKAEEFLKELGETVTISDEDILLNIAKTGMTGKSAEKSVEKLAKIAVEVVRMVTTKDNGSYSANKENIKIDAKLGEV